MKSFHNEILLNETDLFIETFFSENTMFFDIETTGFSPAHTNVYLIGCAYRKGNRLHTDQFFSQNSEDEAAIILSFMELSKPFKTLITFNGTSFDIPYIQNRCKALMLKEPFFYEHHLDLYTLLLPFKKFLKLPNLKQKTIEEFLGLEREDTFSGRELITLYHEYLQCQDKKQLNFMQLHNLEDLTGMTQLLPILSYAQFFEGNFEVLSMELKEYTTYENNQAVEVLFVLKPSFAFPKRVSYGTDDVYLTGFGSKIKVSVKVYGGELKYFYSNYKDYYYLPEEDMAIHKSVAFFVDKNFRTRAKAATCYGKKTGRFLPQYEEIIFPYFKLEYHDKLAYFEISEDFMQSNASQKEYVCHLLKILCNKYKKGRCPA